MNAIRPLQMIKLVDRTAVLHRHALPAYHAISAIPQLLPLAKLPTSTLLELLNRLPLTIVASSPDEERIYVAGGFGAFHVLAALAIAGHKPKRLAVRVVEDDPDLITKLVQTELLSILVRHSEQTGSRDLVPVIRLLTDENAAAIFGDARPSRGAIADLTGASFADLTPARRLSTGSDSGILSSILAANR
jgi:hypothetical protein